MKITLSTDAVTKVRADLLAVPVSQGSPLKQRAVRALVTASGGTLETQIRLEKFEGKAGQTLRATLKGTGAKQVLLVGTGEGPVSVAGARQVGAAAGQAAQRYGSLAILPPSEDAEVIRAVASGALLGSYRFTRYLTGDRLPERALASTKLLVEKRSPDVRQALDAGVVIGECVNHARDLVNAPPNDLTPPALAAFAEAQAKEHGVDCKVWDKKGIQKLGMHLLLAVNAGSGIEPRFVHMTYRPKTPAKAKIAFVGKGLTFDSGGLCLKPAKSMIDMKCDMAGAAATIAIVIAAARLGLPVEVHGIIPSTENMLGDFAYRPGDVFPSLDGKSVEIINTDAEGRLVLADALAYARALSPDVMIDHATLTGACMVALGPWRAGLFTDSEPVASAYAAAAEREGESFWRLPLDKALREGLDSDIADLKHTAEREGGAISAALFLKEFVGETTWMHLDIAGPAFQDRPHGVSGKGGTGFGVLTALRYLESL